ncbi:hypothetical protein POL68_33655 [Stigmatella sp. ncwal1]|uniref:Uncharacterized protein n=1 Tax=Stigmatella ashevillensis TaxID=2995309 RepID=A0ABT5DIH3_9BACT|nr:hypothetical protein [Stigmatella ashevillena]MDC0713459.1 hypothetical protein [Stigmatella ashevillena]
MRRVTLRGKKLTVIGLAWSLGLMNASGGCAHPGTPMHSSCRELPTLEECQAAAQTIAHDCLRQCVELQCSGVKINCQSEAIQKNCRENNNASEGLISLGYVIRFSNRPTSCNNPSTEINWCEEPAPRDCRAKAMAHELAHACGWSHGQGYGVPADDGKLSCE